MACLKAQQRFRTLSALSANYLRSSRPCTGFLLSLSQSRRNYASATETLPGATQPTLWHSMVPKFLRNPQTFNASVKPSRVKEWNPATFFIVIFLLIGSNAIQMIALRHEFTTFSRRAEAKIGLLNEVVERLHQGEDVDVEGLLGTGDKEKEKEWEDVLREIVEEDNLWQLKERNRQRQKEKKAAKEAQAEAAHEPTGAIQEQSDTGTTTPSANTVPNETKASGVARPSFY